MVRAVTPSVETARPRIRVWLRDSRLWLALALVVTLSLGAAALPESGRAVRAPAPRAVVAHAGPSPTSVPALRPMADGRPNPWAGMTPNFLRAMYALDARLTHVRREQGIDALRDLIRRELAEKPQMERIAILAWATRLGYAWCADIVFDHLPAADPTERRNITCFMARHPTLQGSWRPDPARVDQLIAIETDPGIVLDLHELRAWCAP